MKKIISILILLSLVLPIPVHAGVVKELDQIEKEFLGVPEIKKEVKKPADENKRQNEDFAREMKKPEQPKTVKASSGSGWWKWALGIAVVGGAAAAAGGGGGGSSGGGGGGGTVVSTW